LKENRKKISPLLRYSGLGVQLFAASALFAWLGYKLDEYLKQGFPVFLLLFLCLALGGQLYMIYRNLNDE